MIKYLAIGLVGYLILTKFGAAASPGSPGVATAASSLGISSKPGFSINSGAGVSSREPAVVANVPNANPGNDFSWLFSNP